MTKNEIKAHALSLGYFAKYSGNLRQWFFSRVRGFKPQPKTIHNIINARSTKTIGRNKMLVAL